MVLFKFLDALILVYISLKNKLYDLKGFEVYLDDLIFIRKKQQIMMLQ